MLKKIYLYLSSLVASLFIFSTKVSAEITNPVIGKWGEGGSTDKDGSLFVQYVVVIWDAVMVAGALVVIIFFIKAAIEWITAGESKDKIENARNTIIQAIIGLVILVGSFVIINFVSKLLFGNEFNILNPTLPTATTQK